MKSFNLSWLFIWLVGSLFLLLLRHILPTWLLVPVMFLYGFVCVVAIGNRQAKKDNP